MAAGRLGPSDRQPAADYHPGRAGERGA